MIRAVAHQVALPAVGRGDVFQPVLHRRGRDDCSAGLVGQHEIDQSRVLTRAMGIMTGRARALLVQVPGMRKLPRHINRQRIAVLALAAERKILR